MKTALFILPAMTFLYFSLLLPACDSKSNVAEAAPTNNSQPSALLQIPPDVYLKDDLYIEQKPDSAAFFDYSADNRVFVPGRSFLYDYRYIKGGDTLFFSIEKDNTEEDRGWNFSSPGKVSDRTVRQIRLTTEGASDLFGPDYEQTVIRYDYLGLDGGILAGGELTGCIENHKNVWVHPPREFLFRILQLNPFPFIQAPFEMGQHWTGELVVGSFWSDARWRTWEEAVTVHFTYQIPEEVLLITQKGPLECLVVEAEGKSSLGKTRLKAWFHATEGFIRLHYLNIDNSKLLFERAW